MSLDDVVGSLGKAIRENQFDTRLLIFAKLLKSQQFISYKQVTKRDFNWKNTTWHMHRCFINNIKIKKKKKYQNAQWKMIGNLSWKQQMTRSRKFTVHLPIKIHSMQINALHSKFFSVWTYVTHTHTIDREMERDTPKSCKSWILITCTYDYCY